MSCLWKQFPDEMLHKKTLPKKAPNFFWFQVGDLNISDIFEKIQNFNRLTVFPVITHWTYTHISPWALWICFFKDVVSLTFMNLKEVLTRSSYVPSRWLVDSNGLCSHCKKLPHTAGLS